MRFTIWHILVLTTIIAAFCAWPIMSSLAFNLALFLAMVRYLWRQWMKGLPQFYDLKLEEKIE